MLLSIGALSKLSGVSVRALHHYDQMGLLHPSKTAESGYRYYDDAEVERLWQILFYRELDFPLKEIAAILSSPEFDRTRALQEHRALLEQKRERLDGLISLISNTLKGDKTNTMEQEFKPFDTGEIDAMREQFANEAKQRWGNTEAYRESVRREANRSKQDCAELTEKSGAIFAEFAGLVGTDPKDTRVQALVQRWQSFISEYYYPCTNDILAGLGTMYLADERFTNNMDRYGAGTAKLISDGIAVYCSKDK